MNRPVLNEQQKRTLEKMEEIIPVATMEEKMYILGRLEGYTDARAIAGAAARQKREDTEKEAG